MTAIEGKSGVGAEIAYRAVITRHGAQLAEAGDLRAMRAVLDQVAGTDPDQNARRVVVLKAWSAVRGWHLGAGA